MSLSVILLQTAVSADQSNAKTCVFELYRVHKRVNKVGRHIYSKDWRYKN